LRIRVDTFRLRANGFTQCKPGGADGSAVPAEQLNRACLPGEHGGQPVHGELAGDEQDDADRDQRDRARAAALDDAEGQ
jgi:hypothetical protein